MAAGTYDIAWLADGKLFVAGATAQPRPVESQFIQEALDRRAEASERNSWRSSGMMWNLSGPPGMGMPGMGAETGDMRHVRFTSVAGGSQPGELYYALVNEAMGGLFLLDLDEDYERRLVHRQRMQLSDLMRGPDGRLACSLAVGEGASNLALMESDGGKLREVTAGDSVDEAPAWVPGRKDTLVFQSAGIGRHESGAMFGLGPYGVYELDLASERMSVLLEQPKFDCLGPRIDAEGGLLYIRRPYQLDPPASPFKVAGDIVLFPFRLARATVHFLNAFSMMFSEKPLMSAGGPRRQGPDRRALMLWGRWVEVDRKLRNAGADSDKPLVPRSWKLIRRTPDGTESELASSVVAFDLAADGTIVHTNGRAVYRREADGTTRRMARGQLIERLAVLP